MMVVGGGDGLIHMYSVDLCIACIDMYRTLYAFIMEVMVRWEALTASEWRALSKLNFAFLC